MDEIIRLALAEDIGSGDVSAAALPEKKVRAEIVSREPAIICGTDFVGRVFAALDKNLVIDWFIEDGGRVRKNQRICLLSGSASAILSGERTALNFLQMQSAVATKTDILVRLIRDTGCRILDTRKTLPGLRSLQKYAILKGGGVNHRSGLYDALMLKENHIRVCGSLARAVFLARRKFPQMRMIVEVDDVSMLREALALNLEWILCDNFGVDDLKKAVVLKNQQRGGKCIIEASGGIDERNILAYAQTGVDFISIGALTKNIRAVDLSLRILSA